MVSSVSCRLCDIFGTLSTGVPGHSSRMGRGSRAPPDTCYKPRVRREILGRRGARAADGGPELVAAIRPGGKPDGVWALPKGLIKGESPERRHSARSRRRAAAKVGRRQAGRRPVRLHVRRGAGLQGRQLFLVRYTAGGTVTSPRVSEGGRRRALAALEEAPRLLAYKGEREMAQKALMMLAAGAPT